MAAILSVKPGKCLSLNITDPRGGRALFGRDDHDQVTSGRSDELTVAFSRGAGGAVEGNGRESYRLMPGFGTNTISARSPKYRSLPL